MTEDLPPPVAELVSEELVVVALPILDHVAQQLARQLDAQRDDLRSIGHFALTDLIRRYDPSGMPFERYIQQRLRWAIIDGVRRETHHRSAVRRARALAASTHLSEARAPDPQAAMPPSSRSHRLQLSDLLREHALVMGFKLMGSDGREVAATTSSANPERLTQRRAAFEALREAIASLEDDKQRTVVERFYFGGLPLMTIAKQMGITKSWASRLHATAVATLARRLRGIISSR